MGDMVAKDIVILLDGTSNQISTRRTNILRLYGCLKKSNEQLVYYDPGVGTLASKGVWARSRQKFSEFWGMATGQGIDKNVKEAYRFLVENYNKGETEEERDRIWVFGFSRGAYTARMLAGFIWNLGLIEKRNLNLLDYVYRAYKRIGEKEDDDAFKEVRLYERILATDRPPIRFLGLFDSVSSVIEPGAGFLPKLKSHASTSKNPGVESIRHAVALHDRRRMFNATLWPEGQHYRPNPFVKDQNTAQDLKEVWFTGAHGDVGGGLPEEKSALAKIPLIWMIDESRALGLKFVTQTVNKIVHGAGDDGAYVKPDAFAERENPMTMLWRTLEYLPLPVGAKGSMRLGLTRGKLRDVPSQARIHASVIARANKLDDFPPNIPPDHRPEGDPSDWG